MFRKSHSIGCETNLFYPHLMCTNSWETTNSVRWSPCVQLEKTLDSLSSSVNKCLHFCWETPRCIYKHTQRPVRTLILLHLNTNLTDFLMAKRDKAFLASEFHLPASHELSVFLQSFLSCFFGEKMNKSFPSVSSCIVCDDGNAIFYNFQIWKIYIFFFF